MDFYQAYAHADRGTGSPSQRTAQRTFKVGPDVGVRRQVEVSTKAIFNPRILTVQLHNRAVTTRHGACRPRIREQPRRVRRRYLCCSGTSCQTRHLAT